MKLALSFTLVLALILPSLPAAAQDTPGPIAQALRREVIRLAANQQGRKPVSADWARVRTLAPGTEITVVTRGLHAGKRYVLSADDSELMALDLSDPTIPGDVATALRDAASTHPEYFVRPQQPGASFPLGQNVYLTPALGVFAGRQKIDLSQIVVRIARADVEDGSITVAGPGPRHKGRNIAIAVAVIYVAGAIISAYGLAGREAHDR